MQLNAHRGQLSATGLSLLFLFVCVCVLLNSAGHINATNISVFTNITTFHYCHFSNEASGMKQHKLKVRGSCCRRIFSEMCSVILSLHPGRNGQPKQPTDSFLHCFYKEPTYIRPGGVDYVLQIRLLFILSKM